MTIRGMSQQYALPPFIPAPLDFTQSLRPVKKVVAKRRIPPPPPQAIIESAQTREPIPEPESCFKRLILSSGGVRFEGEDFRRLCRPLVYMFLKDGVSLYIGFSAGGLARPSQRRHHAKIARDEADELLIWPTRTKADAKELESILIFVMRPKYNRRLPLDPMKKTMIGTAMLREVRLRHIA